MAVVLGERREQSVVRRVSKVTTVQRGRQLLVVWAEVRVRVVHGQVPVAECGAQHPSCLTQLWGQTQEGERGREGEGGNHIE